MQESTPVFPAARTQEAAPSSTMRSIRGADLHAILNGARGCLGAFHQVLDVLITRSLIGNQDRCIVKQRNPYGLKAVNHNIRCPHHVRDIRIQPVNDHGIPIRLTVQDLLHAKDGCTALHIGHHNIHTQVF